jgi:predicted Zn-dependent peptidase
MFASILAIAMAGAAPAQGDLPWIPHQRYRLPNGLDVVLHDDDRYPLVAVRVIYHVGSMHDPIGKQGVAHLLEHAMFSGSTHVGDGEHFSKLIHAGASASNATTTAWSTVYLENLPANQLDVALWLESDRMGWFNPRAHRSDLEKERDIIIQEIAQRTEGGELAIAFTGLSDLLFPVDHPMHLQDRRTLTSITVDDVAAMASRYYGPANATLVIAGDLPDDVRERVEHYFGSLEGGERPSAKLKPLALRSSPNARVRSARTRVPIVLVGWPTPGLFEPGDAEADVLAAVIAARTDAGTSETVITGISAQQRSELGQSVFTLEVEGRPGAAPSAMLAELDAFLARIAGGELTDMEVSIAARRFATRVHAPLDSVGGRADRLAIYIKAGKPADWVEEDTQRYRHATRTSVSAFVRTWLHRRPRATVQIDPATAGAR